MAYAGLAGGIADGLRTGMQLYSIAQRGQVAQEDREERKADRERIEKERRAQAWIQSGDGAAPAGLSPIEPGQARSAPAEAVSNGGLEPIPTAAAQPSRAAAAPVASGVGLEPLNPAAPSAPVGQAFPVARAPGASAPAPQIPPPSELTAMVGAGPTVPAASGLQQAPKVDDDERIIDSLNGQLQRALQAGRPDLAIQAWKDREQLSHGVFERALGAADTAFGASGDPNVFKDLFNRYAGTNALRIPGEIKKVQTTDASGRPITGYALQVEQNGKLMPEQIMSEAQFQQTVQTLRDPKTRMMLRAQEAQAIVKQGREIELERAKAGAQAEGKIAAAKGMAPIERETDRLRNEQRTAGDLRVAAARGSIDRKTAEPAEIRTMRYLMDNGVAKDQNDAWNKVRGSREKTELDFAQEYARDVLRDQRDSFGADKLTPAQAIDQGREVYRASRGGGAATGTGAAPAPASKPAGTPAGPSVGTVESGYRFLGGDPSNAGNWEKAR